MAAVLADLDVLDLVERDELSVLGDVAKADVASLGKLDRVVVKLHVKVRGDDGRAYELIWSDKERYHGQPCGRGQAAEIVCEFGFSLGEDDGLLKQRWVFCFDESRKKAVKKKIQIKFGGDAAAFRSTESVRVSHWSLNRCEVISDARS